MDLGGGSATRPWLAPAVHWPAMSRAVAELPAPVGALHLGALRWNVAELLRRAGGMPIRVASKSLRVRPLIEDLLRVPGFHGVLAYTLPEALWLAETIDDVVVGYPSADRAALAVLSRDERLARRVTLMIDDVDQMELIERSRAGGERIRVAIELDASWNAPVLGHLGVLRSPVHSPQQAAALARAVLARPGLELVGMMSYEAQIAGVTDRPPGRPVTGAVNRWMQAHSLPELRERRAAAVAAVRALAPLEFVNGGGTGSLETTSADPSVTEVAAGSGIFGGHLFDGYGAFTPAPAAAFALDVVRRPDPDTVTLLGGGWIASGPPGADRVPQPVWPAGLRFAPREGAGEVQTPLQGRAARALALGDRVWLRHTKSGELSERLAAFAVVERSGVGAGEYEVVGSVPTYRGEGRVFV
ncbi:alanine racemase [Microbacteriaceae bacterium VKM Ac-2855]|nr:alanine racemase [Microbacteriaceae bacterium VKM Ac-2855]